MRKRPRVAALMVVAILTGGLATGCGSDTSADVFVPVSPSPSSARQASPTPTRTPNRP